ncbi:MAG: thiamine biosynthesis lipoprotein [Kiritimatiellia bacterium]|jgi:FAD:protein FMN transferase
MMEPREFKPLPTLVGALIIGGLIATSYLRQPMRPHSGWNGETMGTTWALSAPYSALKASGYQDIRVELLEALTELNAQMSTYIEDSEISTFNASTNTEAFTVSEPFARMVQHARDIAQETDGAFDPTVWPLVEMWGFGAEERTEVPDEAALTAARARVGWEQVEVIGTNQLRKTAADVQLDLSAIAKGFAVDRLAEIMAAHSLTNYYINVGGEIRVSGISEHGHPWRIGIEVPKSETINDIYAIALLNKHAMATSGDYRNYYIRSDTNRYTHIIDPRTGRPVKQSLASVSVIADSCWKADAIATALIVLGPDAGKRWVEAHEGVEAYFIERDAAGKLSDFCTPGFQALLKPEE